MCHRQKSSAFQLLAASDGRCFGTWQWDIPAKIDAKPNRRANHLWRMTYFLSKWYLWQVWWTMITYPNQASWRPITVKRNGTRVKALPDSVCAVAMSSCISQDSYLMNKNDSRLAIVLCFIGATWIVPIELPIGRPVWSGNNITCKYTGTFYLTWVLGFAISLLICCLFIHVRIMLKLGRYFVNVHQITHR